MKIISHRGLLEGPNPNIENNPTTIEKALFLGFDVEIDVWYINKNWFLGHDNPCYKIKFSYLKNNKLWVHAKNINAMKHLVEFGKDVNFFWHQEDDVTLTSKNFIWTSPGKELTPFSVCVMPEKKFTIKESILLSCFGICTDFPVMAKQESVLYN